VAAVFGKQHYNVLRDIERVSHLGALELPSDLRATGIDLLTWRVWTFDAGLPLITGAGVRR
jgi:hypothetical protein